MYCHELHQCISQIFGLFLTFHSLIKGKLFKAEYEGFLYFTCFPKEKYWKFDSLLSRSVIFFDRRGRKKCIVTWIHSGHLLSFIVTLEASHLFSEFMGRKFNVTGLQCQKISLFFLPSNSLARHRIWGWLIFPFVLSRNLLFSGIYPCRWEACCHSNCLSFCF